MADRVDTEFNPLNPGGSGVPRETLSRLKKRVKSPADYSRDECIEFRLLNGDVFDWQALHAENRGSAYLSSR